MNTPQKTILWTITALLAIWLLTTPPTPSTAHAHTTGPSRREPLNQARTTTGGWVRATISHYGEGDGYGYQRTMCGRIVKPNSRFVAALKPTYAHCGMKLTILYHGHRFHTTVQDRGAYRSDDRALDAAPGLRHQMHFTGIAHIRIKKGWV